MPKIESLNEADTSHMCHQQVYVNLSTPLKEVIPCLPSLHRALYNNLLYSEGRGGHTIPTHSLKMLQTNIRSSKWLLKTKHAPCLATYLMRALWTTTAVLGCVEQIYQCNTPLGRSSPGQRRGRLNSCAKMASRSVRSPLIQTVLLVKLQIPLQGRSATKGACVFIS